MHFKGCKSDMSDRALHFLRWTDPCKITYQTSSNIEFRHLLFEYFLNKTPIKSSFNQKVLVIYIYEMILFIVDFSAIIMA